MFRYPLRRHYSFKVKFPSKGFAPNRNWKKKMEYVVHRKLQQQADSFLVCLPRLWCLAKGLRKGSVVEITLDDCLVIKPVEKGITGSEPK